MQYGYARQFGYARVSTFDQHADMQHSALTKAGWEKLYTDDGLSGATAQRPATAASRRWSPDYVRDRVAEIMEEL